MSYQALYRKYRPMSFSEVVGQDVATKTLQNALSINRISHAYLFSGPRGIGKTTISKILAKSVNCLELDHGNACGRCKNCIAASKRECPDIIEIDAASNNGVDEIRELRDKVNLVPTELKYKVYIIDEVHMLSIGAFNALLKTLEEPPSHVIFILATTDLHKVPITIISRCQCFHFKRICTSDIVDRLKKVVQNENISIDDDVLVSIANYSDGGMRDALGLLDKLVSYSSEHITMTDMQEVNGLVSVDDMKTFIEQVRNHDVSFVLNQLNRYYQDGKDLIRFVEEMILCLRNQLVSKYLDHDENVDSLFVSQFAIRLNHILNDLKNGSNLKVLLEIELLQFMDQNLQGESSVSSPKEEKSFSASKEEIIVQEEKITKNHSDVKSISEFVTEKQEKVNDKRFDHTKLTHDQLRARTELRIHNTFALATKNDLVNIRNQWGKIMDFTLDREIGAIACFLADSVAVAASPKNVILTFEYDSMIERGNDMMERVELAFQKIFGQFYHLVFLTSEEWIKEKQQYVLNKNNQVQYTYQEELETADVLKSENDNNDLEVTDLTKEVVRLFGSDIVKVDD